MMNPDVSQDTWIFTPSVRSDGATYVINRWSDSPNYYQLRETGAGSFSEDMLREFANWILSVLGPA